MNITPEQDAGLDLEPGVEAVEEASGKLSILDRARIRREQRVADETLKLDIPTWGGELQGRYQIVDRPTLESLMRRLRAQQNGSQSADPSAADIDFLIRACNGIIAVDAETGEEEEVATGYNLELAELLGVEATRARDVVLYLFKSNGIALAAHAFKVAKWMQDPSKPVEDPQ